MQSLKAELRQMYCQPGSVLRSCFAVPDDAACGAAFDAAWPECTRDIVLREAPSDENRRQGVRAGRCITEELVANFPDRRASPACAAAMATQDEETLAQARHDFHTKVHDASARSGPPPIPPPELFSLVRVPSPAGALPAYVTPRPSKPMRLPAIVWIAGGFDPSIDASFWSPAPRSNDQSARAFREAGMVLMLPARRGGNDSTAPRESLFGEVGDVIAAADFLSKLDYVDPTRIYLGGHSTGGTLALLVAETTDRFRAVFAFGPVANVAGYGKSLTFDTSDEDEVRVRSPGYFLSSIRSPTFVLEGGAAPSNADQLAQLTPRKPGVPVHVHPVPGFNHFSVLSPATELLAKKLVSSASGDIDITQEELDALATTADGRRSPRTTH